MMIHAAPIPYYSEYRERKPPKKKSAKAQATAATTARPLTSSAAESSSPATLGPSATNLDPDMDHLLEPAMDGPPSPERLRALNNQMKQAANLEKHKAHHQPSASTSAVATATTASSPYHATTADRPWDQVLENISLSRRSSGRSSGRSTSSSMPSRERPDSVQLFGKAIFGRKARLKRDSSANSSSASSLYSGDTPLDTLPPLTTKDHNFIPSIFGRRKAAKSDPWGDGSVTPMALKKHSISGPYNFQHVTHTRQSQAPPPPPFQRASRMGSVAEFPLQQAGFEYPDDSRFPDLPPESNFVTDPALGGGSVVLNQINHAEHRARMNLERPPIHTTYAAPRAGPRRLVKSAKSQEQIRAAPRRPPRPPRSPIIEDLEAQQQQQEQQQPASPPVPPPRLSSRQSIRYGGYDPLETTSLGRPQTSGGFRKPEPFHFIPEQQTDGLPLGAHIYSTSVDFGLLPDSSFHHAVTTPDDEAWPLTPTTTATTTTLDEPLADVPEEDEAAPPRARRASVISTSSSLRRSQSVPQLRRSAQLADFPETTTRRPPSAGSDTLGRFDLFAAQRALRASSREDDDLETPNRSSWEDDIDFCYDNELEADCDYEWTRPSMDTCREDSDSAPFPALVVQSLASPSRSTATTTSPMLGSGHFLSADGDDVPALSPASQMSLNDPEAITPTIVAPPPVPSFSSRRPGVAAGLGIQKLRPASHASSFMESHGFTLSPSLLIPGDFHQQMMLTTSDYGSGGAGAGPAALDDYRRYNDRFMSGGGGGGGGGVLGRDSTSTLGTDSTRSVTTAEERHESTSTAFTRFTSGDDDGASSADHRDSWGVKSESQHHQHPAVRSDECFFVEQLIPTAGSETDVAMSGLVAPDSGRAGEDMPLGYARPRAKTTSLASPQPRAANFSLFPRSPSMSTRRVS